MKKKLYVETSVWNQVDQTERIDWREITEKFLVIAGKGLYDIYISDAVLLEFEKCPKAERKNQLLDLVNKHQPTLLPYDSEARALRLKYVETGIMSDLKENKYYDTAHVAIASVNQIPYVLTFNFTHLLKINKIEAFNGVNILNGYGQIQIVSPQMFITEEE